MDGQKTTKTRIEEILPLSPLQEGLLFHAMYSPEQSAAYTMQLSLDFSGDLDVAVLRESARVLLARHAILRTAFRTRRSGQPIQVVLREVEPPWSEADLTGADLTGATLDGATLDLANTGNAIGVAV